MKTICFYHSGLLYKIPNILFARYMRAYRKNDLEKMAKYEKEMSEKYTPIFVDFLKTD